VAAFGFWLRTRVLSVIAAVDHAVHDLELLVAVFKLIEARSFDARRLDELQETLSPADGRVSAQIARLHRLAELIHSRDNVVMRAIGPPVLFGTHLAFATERWRAQSGPHVRSWLAALSEFEALLSLGGYAYEHSADPFPEIIDEMLIDGEELGHP